jgi:CheY-like chemotaxis protein
MKPLYPDLCLPGLLIVDDCEDDIFLLRHRLREGGITNPITAFTSPANALAFLRAQPAAELPSLVFTDIRMPGGCGFALISAIRGNPEWSGIRVVVVTGSNQTADLERSLECGANGYLIKMPTSELLADFVLNGPWFAVPRGASAPVHALSA